MRLAGAAVGSFRIWGQELRELPPPDRSGRDRALAETLNAMRIQVKARDYRGLEARMRPDFKVEFDGGKGPNAFRRRWKADTAASGIWPLLDALLAIGGAFYSETLFAIPYVYARFPQDLDPLGHVVSIRQQTNLWEKPEPGARVLATAGYAILPLSKPLEPPVMIEPAGFVEVNHPTSGICYAAASDVCSPAGHRMFFELRRGRWQWISLAAATLADPAELRPAKRP